MIRVFEIGSIYNIKISPIGFCTYCPVKMHGRFTIGRHLLPGPTSKFFCAGHFQFFVSLFTGWLNWYFFLVTYLEMTHIWKMSSQKIKFSRKLKDGLRERERKGENIEICFYLYIKIYFCHFIGLISQISHFSHKWDFSMEI